MRSIVIVGASLAGLRAAEGARAAGFDGSITLIGDEPHAPYDRPPLSKDVLGGSRDPAATRLSSRDDLAVDWLLGQRAIGLDLDARRVPLASGEAVGFDGLVIATGARARRLPDQPALPGVCTLRTLDDALALRDALAGGSRRLVVVGAGFIGAEAAATARQAGHEVTILEALPAPLVRGLGERMGLVLAEVHRDHGVDVRLSTGVAAIEGNGRVEHVVLASGERIAADLVLVGVGATPNTEWLEGSGLVLDNGVVCDDTALAAPGVVAAGDVARWWHPRYAQHVRIEHWDNAVTMGDYAGRRLVTGEAAPYAPVPWFWSDQYDRKIQLAGRTEGHEVVEVVDGSVEDRRFVALYGRAGVLTGVLGMNRPPKVMRLRALLDTDTPFADAVAAARA